MDGVVRAPSEFSMTRVSPPSMTATHELVVPRSMPMTFAMILLSLPSRSPRPQRRRVDPRSLCYLPEKPGQDRGYIGPMGRPAMVPSHWDREIRPSGYHIGPERPRIERL